ncbi:MAG: tellurite resistance protein TerA [Patiriisocius sp.]
MSITDLTPISWRFTMTTLAMGANAPISSPSFTLDVHLPQGAQVDVTALQLYADGKVRGDDDMCFYNQTSIGGGAISLKIAADTQSFSFDLDKAGADVEKIVVNATLDGGVFSSVNSLKISLSSDIDMSVETAGRTEAALILCEIYKRNSQWKIRNVSQGFNGGLQALAEHFGVDVAAPETPAPTPKPAPVPVVVPVPVARPAAPKPVVPASTATPATVAAPTPVTPTAPSPAIDLEKVTLTKTESSILLNKDDGNFGRIRVNLNWDQSIKKGGFLGMGTRSVGLDLGAFVESETGDVAVIQMLGDSFGDFDELPFTKLIADDTTDTATEGKCLEINGSAWSSLRRVLIFAYMREGVADWLETRGIIRIMVPGQPEVEVRLNELSSNKREIICAVALLENKNNQISINREVRLFEGHEQMDTVFGWHMSWQAGK